MPLANPTAMSARCAVDGMLCRRGIRRGSRRPASFFDPARKIGMQLAAAMLERGVDRPRHAAKAISLGFRASDSALSKGEADEVIRCGCRRGRCRIRALRRQHLSSSARTNMAQACDLYGVVTDARAAQVLARHGCCRTAVAAYDSARRSPRMREGDWRTQPADEGRAGDENWGEHAKQPEYQDYTMGRARKNRSFL